MATHKDDPRLACLSDWRSLNKAVAAMNEADCLFTLQHAQKVGSPIRFVFRLHSRYNRVRAAAERARIEAGVSFSG